MIVKNISRKAAKRAPARRAISYREAVAWIVENDDTNWLHDPDDPPSVTACFVADIYGRTEEEVTADLRKMLGLAA